MTEEELKQKIKDSPNSYMKEKYLLELQELRKTMKTKQIKDIIDDFYKLYKLGRKKGHPIGFIDYFEARHFLINEIELSKSLLGTSKMIIKKGKPIIQ